MNHLPIKLALSILFTLGTANSIFAQTEAPAQPSVGDCSREFLIAYFPPSLVEGALKKANIPQDKWAPITKALTASEKDIITQVEDKASKITPNPLKDPQQRQVAVKIFRDTLLSIFSDVLKKNGITDDNQIQQMLDEIQQEKARKFTDCLGQHKIPTLKQLKEMEEKEEKAKAPLADASNPSSPLNQTSKQVQPNGQSSKSNLNNHDSNTTRHGHDNDDSEDSEDSADSADSDDSDDSDDSHDHSSFDDENDHRH
ncbi:MAG: hypothetical protein H0U49_04810 [Parachlamydiaceae bacterium]|nr:hypothetical protein [Parachlamydiaceae bacterium]